MTVRAERAMWGTSAALLLIAGAAVVLAAWKLPIDLSVTTDSPAVARTMTSASRPASLASLPTVEDLEAAARVELRRPLYETASQVTPEVLPALPLFLRLTGTVIEPGRSMGVFAVGIADVQLVGVGGTVAGAEVLEVRSSSVILRYQGRTIEMVIAKPIDPTIELSTTPAGIVGGSP